MFVLTSRKIINLNVIKQIYAESYGEKCQAPCIVIVLQNETIELVTDDVSTAVSAIDEIGSYISANTPLIDLRCYMRGGV